jgi:hypothetical protein
MPVVTTAVKNQPSNRASWDLTARVQRSRSSCMATRVTDSARHVWQVSDLEVLGVEDVKDPAVAKVLESR